MKISVEVFENKVLRRKFEHKRQENRREEQSV
jgi:hypothetical protein